MNDIIVRKSGIHGKGVFAARNFRKGEVVVRWTYDKKLSEAELENLPREELKYASRLEDDMFVVIGEPARFVNHSCDANTIAVGGADIASCDIATGEEITANYRAEDYRFRFSCNCGSKNCVKIVGNTT